jgi:Protein of unknown function (DUF3089)
MALVAAACSTSSSPSSTTGTKAARSTTTTTISALSGSTVWLCKPGMVNDPCAYSPTVTAVYANGAQGPSSFPASSQASNPSKFDCFFVYPTVSQAKTANTGLAPGSGEIGAAVDLASPFSKVCSVWAPMYRSATAKSIEAGLYGRLSVLTSTFNVAYASLLNGWNDFLAHEDNGRPVILIGDSQGSAILIHLISTVLDKEPSVLHRLVLAIIAGGNLQVPLGKTVGATFKHVPVCTRESESGCAIAFSSFPSEPPSDALFGRPGQGVSLQSDQTAKSGEQVACVNPAALGGGTSELGTYFLSGSQTALHPAASTHWVFYPDMYSATCESSGGATWLQVTHTAGSSDKRPLVQESLGPLWGYHGVDINLALGNLVLDVAAAEASWKNSES